MTTATAHFCGNGLSRLPSTDNKMERGTIMKVKELLKMDVDIDVYDDVCEELAIAKCGAYELSEEAQKHFAEALEYDCELHSDGGYTVCIAHVDDHDESVWKHKLSMACELFYSLAGYCAADDYDKWFKEVE